VTFADSVLHLVRAGARIDSWGASDPAESADSPAILTVVQSDAEAAAVADEVASITARAAAQAGDEAANVAAHEYDPGLADLEAAVGLVSTGLAKRVVLSGFPSWPGLLWSAYQLAGSTGVLILPTVVRPGGRVDIVITRDIAANG
jgi:hypothetical protein